VVDTTLRRWVYPPEKEQTLSADDIQYPTGVKPTTDPQIIYVGPSLAAEWIDSMVRNRPLRDRRVDAWARDMKAIPTNWRLTGEAVQFDWDGHLFDGHHRLMAVVESETTQPFLVMCGLDPATQDVIDAGATRSAGDMFGLHGEHNVNVLASVVRIALTLAVNPNAKTNLDLTHSEILAWVKANPSIRDAVSAITLYHRRIKAPAGATAYAWWLLAAKDQEACEEFFASMAEQRLSGHGDGRLALLRRLEDIKDHRKRLPPIAYIAMIVRAWNAWRTDEVLYRMVTPDLKAPITIPKAV
jgi:hypothetical protein